PVLGGVGRSECSASRGNDLASARPALTFARRPPLRPWRGPASISHPIFGNGSPVAMSRIFHPIVNSSCESADSECAAPTLELLYNSHARTTLRREHDGRQRHRCGK